MFEVLYSWKGECLVVNVNADPKDVKSLKSKESSPMNAGCDDCMTECMVSNWNWFWFKISLILWWSPSPAGECMAVACDPVTDRCRSQVGDCDLGNCSHLLDRPKVKDTFHLHIIWIVHLESLCLYLHLSEILPHLLNNFKGTVSREFSIPVFFIEQLYLGPWWTTKYIFKLCFKFAELFEFQLWLPVI
jgi:hypothetical protein